MLSSVVRDTETLDMTAMSLGPASKSYEVQYDTRDQGASSILVQSRTSIIEERTAKLEFMPMLMHSLASKCRIVGSNKCRIFSRVVYGEQYMGESS